MSILTALTNRQRWARYWDSLKYAFYTMFHPFDGFWDLTHEKRGSMAAAHTIVIAVLIVRLLGLEHTSFLFNNVYWPEVNILQQCLSVLLPLVIFVVGNWGLTTLFDGKGRLKDVYMGTCYALFPYVLLQIPMIILSNWITVDEASFYTILNTLSLIWAGGLIVCGMMMIHDYSLAKTLLFIVMTIFAMAVIIFLILLFFTLVGDGVGYFTSIYKEITFRLY
ncbi:MAG: YIP1 family protein [Clostridia bacterium]|nr:YIP1 family protein [Clostridia bacterium]